MDDLDTMLAQQRHKLAEMPFKPEEWTCSEAELEEISRQFGEKLAHTYIEIARKRNARKRKQAEELRWACQIACSFNASSMYSLPILIQAIRELEQK